MSPAPAELSRVLLARGDLTQAEAALAARVPVAEDVTAEADSGGHTDNRPPPALLPAVIGLRDTLADRFGHAGPIRVGAAGGLGAPQGVAAACAASAAYVVTGTVNQVSVEAGISDDAKAPLAQADIADAIMAPAADMCSALRLPAPRRSLPAVRYTATARRGRDRTGGTARPARAGRRSPAAARRRRYPISRARQPLGVLGRGHHKHTRVQRNPAA
jgi:NAD(P)H-dependent flavin oxidoreductase YrpB (nitropropane dioxygenase family)